MVAHVGEAAVTGLEVSSPPGAASQVEERYAAAASVAAATSLDIRHR